MRAMSIDVVVGKLTRVSKSINSSTSLWAVYDEVEMWENVNEYVEDEAESLYDLELTHGRGVYLEEYGRDWSIVEKDGETYLDYYSKMFNDGSRVQVILVY